MVSKPLKHDRIRKDLTQSRRRSHSINVGQEEQEPTKNTNGTKKRETIHVQRQLTAPKSFMDESDDSEDIDEVDARPRSHSHQVGPPQDLAAPNAKSSTLDASIHAGINMGLQQRHLELRSELAKIEEQNKAYEAELDMLKNSATISRVFELKDRMEEALSSPEVFPKSLPGSFSRNSSRMGSFLGPSRPLSPSLFRPPTPKEFGSSSLPQKSGPSVPTQVLLVELQSITETGSRLIEEVQEQKIKAEAEVAKRSRTEAKVHQLEERVLMISSLEEQLRRANDELWKEGQLNEKHLLDKKEIEIQLKTVSNQEKQLRTKLTTATDELEKLRLEIQALKDVAAESQAKHEVDGNIYRKTTAGLTRDNKALQEKVRNLERELSAAQQSRLISIASRDALSAGTFPIEDIKPCASGDELKDETEGPLQSNDTTCPPSLNFASEAMKEKNSKLTRSILRLEATKKRYRKKLEDQQKLLEKFQAKIKQLMDSNYVPTAAASDDEEWIWEVGKPGISQGSEIDDSDSIRVDSPALSRTNSVLSDLDEEGSASSSQARISLPAPTKPRSRMRLLRRRRSHSPPSFHLHPDPKTNLSFLAAHAASSSEDDEPINGNSFAQELQAAKSSPPPSPVQAIALRVTSLLQANTSILAPPKPKLTADQINFIAIKIASELNSDSQSSSLNDSSAGNVISKEEDSLVNTVPLSSQPSFSKNQVSDTESTSVHQAAPPSNIVEEAEVSNHEISTRTSELIRDPDQVEGPNNGCAFPSASVILESDPSPKPQGDCPLAARDSSGELSSVSLLKKISLNSKGTQTEEPNGETAQKYYSGLHKPVVGEVGTVPISFIALGMPQSEHTSFKDLEHFDSSNSALTRDITGRGSSIDDVSSTPSHSQPKEYFDLAEVVGPIEETSNFLHEIPVGEEINSKLQASEYSSTDDFGSTQGKETQKPVIRNDGSQAFSASQSEGSLEPVEGSHPREVPNSEVLSSMSQDLRDLSSIKSGSAQEDKLSLQAAINDHDTVSAASSQSNEPLESGQEARQSEEPNKEFYSVSQPPLSLQTERKYIQAGTSCQITSATVAREISTDGDSDAKPQVSEENASVDSASKSNGSLNSGDAQAVALAISVIEHSDSNLHILDKLSPDNVSKRSRVSFQCADRSVKSPDTTKYLAPGDLFLTPKESPTTDVYQTALESSFHGSLSPIDVDFKDSSGASVVPSPNEASTFEKITSALDTNQSETDHDKEKTPNNLASEREDLVSQVQLLLSSPSAEAQAQLVLITQLLSQNSLLHRTPLPTARINPDHSRAKSMDSPRTKRRSVLAGPSTVFSPDNQYLPNQVPLPFPAISPAQLQPVANGYRYNLVSPPQHSGISFQTMLAQAGLGNLESHPIARQESSDMAYSTLSLGLAMQDPEFTLSGHLPPPESDLVQVESRHNKLAQASHQETPASYQVSPPLISSVLEIIERHESNPREDVLPQIKALFNYPSKDQPNRNATVYISDSDDFPLNTDLPKDTQSKPARTNSQRSQRSSIGSQVASVIHRIASLSPQVKRPSSSRSPPIAEDHGIEEVPNLAVVNLQPPSSINSVLHATDDAVVLGITQAMSGEYLHKFVRSSTFATDTVHRRFFWLNPYTRVLAWARREPEFALDKRSPRQVYIRSVEEVYDDYRHQSMKDDCNRAIVVHTSTSEIRIKADSLIRHELWWTALSYVQHHVTDDSAKETRERFWSTHKSRSPFLSKQSATPSVQLSDGATPASIPTSRSVSTPAKEFITHQLSKMRSFTRTHTRGTSAGKNSQTSSPMGSPRSGSRQPSISEPSSSQPPSTTLE